MTILELFIHDRNADGDVELFKFLVEAEKKQGAVCVEDLLWRCSWYYCVDILKGKAAKIENSYSNFIRFTVKFGIHSSLVKKRISILIRKSLILFFL